MVKAGKVSWTLVDGVYRAVINNRAVWVYRAGPGAWNYGTAGGSPLPAVGAVERTMALLAVNRGERDVMCRYGASRKHLAMQDAALLANSLQPQDRPTREIWFGAITYGWHFNPAVRAADAAIRRAAEAEESCLRQRAAQYAGMTVDSLEYEIESCESVLDRDSGSEFAPLNRVALAMLNAELARRLVFRQIATTGDVTLMANV